MLKHRAPVLIAMAILLATSITCFGATTPGPCEGITVDFLKAHVPLPPSTIMSRQPRGDLCEVILDIGGRMVPVYATKDFVIAGEMYKDRQQVTQATITRLRQERFRSLKGELDKYVSMTLKPPQGPVKQVVYMITDPVCPFCHRAESKLQELSRKYGAEFRLVIYNVHGLAGKQKAVEAICRHLTAEQYLKGDWKKENKTQDYQCAEGEQLYNRTGTLFRKLGLGGVPAFYTASGKLIMGANIPLLTRTLANPEHPKLSRAN